MKFVPTQFSEVWVIEREPHSDDRGMFSRTYCDREFAEHGLNTRWPQGNLTRTLKRGTIRGMHWQAEPTPEVKLVRCSAGVIWDVAVDVRKDSPTFGKWFAVELSEENGRQLYIPAGFAHGFQCLADNSEVDYMMGATYVPDLARGLRWNDPQVAIQWPLPAGLLSSRDRDLPLLSELS